MLAEARRRHPDVEFVCADAEALPFADGAFDVALGAFLVNHLPDAETAIAEMRRVASRVALAAWGPEDEVAFLALPSRAAATSTRASRTARAPSATPTAERLAALVGGTVGEVRTTLHVDTLDELWDGIRGGTVRTAARLEAASPTRRAARPRGAHPARRAVRGADGLRPPADDPDRPT